MHSAYVLALFETRENRVFDLERCYFVQFQKNNEQSNLLNFFLFLLRVKNVVFCLCFGLIDSL